jgi:hypothetical protein
MTRTTNARIAGVTFLAYIASPFTSMSLFARATSGEGVAAQLATIARHATDVRLTVLLGLLRNLCALVLAVTLYAITRGIPIWQRWPWSVASPTAPALAAGGRVVSARCLHRLPLETRYSRRTEMA